MQSVTIKDTKNIVKKAHQLLVSKGRSIPMMIWGPMGVGKSDGMRQVAEELKIKLIDIRLTLLNAVDLRGLPTVDRKNGLAVWLSSGFLPIAERDGAEGILFLDEINLAPMTVMNAGYQLILDRKIGDYTLPPGWSVVAAGNRAEDSNNLTKMPNPLLNRFIHYQIERPDADEWRDWAMKNGINDRVIAFLGKFPQRLMETPKAGEKAFPSPRSWSFASDLVNMGEPIDAAVGGGAATEYKAFTEVYERVPDIKRILAGEKERMPKANELDVLWATSMAIAIAAEPKHWSNVFAYIDGFPTEFEAMLIKLLSEKSDEFFTAISHSDEFNKFTKAHPDAIGNMN